MNVEYPQGVNPAAKHTEAEKESKIEERGTWGGMTDVFYWSFV